MQAIILVILFFFLSGCDQLKSKTPEAVKIEAKSDFFDEKGNSKLPKQIILETIKDTNFESVSSDIFKSYHGFEFGFIKHPLLYNTSINGQSTIHVIESLYQMVAKVFFGEDFNGKILIIPDMSVDAHADYNTRNIILTYGLLDNISSFDQLVGIIFHELGHLALKHNEKAVFSKWATFRNDKTYAENTLSKSMGDTAVTMFLLSNPLSILPATFLLDKNKNKNSLQFESIKNEQEADMFAVDLLANYKIDVFPYIDFLSSLSSSESHLDGLDRQTFLKGYVNKFYNGGENLTRNFRDVQFDKDYNFILKNDHYSIYYMSGTHVIEGYKYGTESLFEKEFKKRIHHASSPAITNFAYCAIAVNRESNVFSKKIDECISILNASIDTHGPTYRVAELLSYIYYKRHLALKKGSVGSYVYLKLSHDTLYHSIKGLDYYKLSKIFDFSTLSSLRNLFLHNYKRYAVTEEDGKSINGKYIHSVDHIMTDTKYNNLLQENERNSTNPYAKYYSYINKFKPDKLAN